jgi:molecular chaperone DnaJ
MGAAGARAGGPFGDFGSFGDVFEDIFGQMMGGMGRGKRQNRGQDLRYNLEISLEEAFQGRSAEIRVPTMVACEICAGSGAEPGHSPETCPTCAGHGKVRATQGFFTIERTCSACRGSGKIIRNPCKTCRGAGLVQKERTLNVDVPPGVEEGTRIRLSGEGAAGANGGPPGDLYIFLSVTEHPIFQRDGHDLHCRAPVSFVTAAMGGSIEVPTLDGGRAKVAIPEGTQPGRQFRLKGKGMPVLRSAQKGDLYVELAVETPVKLTKRQKELLREFDAESQAGTHPEAEGFLARLKEFWSGCEK